MDHARGEGRNQGGRGGRPFIECIQWRDSRCTMVLAAWGSGPKNRGMTRPEWSRPAPFIIPTDTRTSFLVFRNYRLLRQPVAFQKRFRLMGLPLPEIRHEFDRNTSNAGMLQSEMRYLARFQEFHRLSTRRHRVLSRQSGDLRTCLRMLRRAFAP